MKRSITYIFLAAIVLFSCRKSDNAKLPDLIRVPTPLITKDATADQTISAQDANKFSGKAVIDLFFKSDVKPLKFDAVIRKNENNAVVKLLQADITTFPTTVPLTGAQLVSLFGSPVVLGDKFDVGVDITTQGGQKYLAFPTVGASYAASVSNQVGASITARFEAVCKFDPSIYQGNFSVLVDGWADYNVGDVVPVKLVNATTLSFEYAVSSNSMPILIKVDPVTNITSVTKQIYGNYGAEIFSAESVAGADNFVAPCDGIVSVKLHHTSNKADYGNYVIKLKKK